MKNKTLFFLAGLSHVAITVHGAATLEAALVSGQAVYEQQGAACVPA